MEKLVKQSLLTSRDSSGEEARCRQRFPSSLASSCIYPISFVVKLGIASLKKHQTAGRLAAFSFPPLHYSLTHSIFCISLSLGVGCAGWISVRENMENMLGNICASKMSTYARDLFVPLPPVVHSSWLQNHQLIAKPSTTGGILMAA